MHAANNRIITRRISPEAGAPEEMPSGLYVVKEKEQHWDDFMLLKVLSVGPEVKEEISFGDTVIARGMAGADMVVNGEKYIVIHDADALAILDD